MGFAEAYNSYSTSIANTIVIVGGFYTAYFFIKKYAMTLLKKSHSIKFS